MGAFLLGLFTVVLILLSLFTTLVILMQRASSNAGMGSALGGGAAEAAFGGDSGNILSRTTIMCTTAFFVITFCLYLGYMVRVEDHKLYAPALPSIEAAGTADGEAETQGSSSQGLSDIESLPALDSDATNAEGSTAESTPTVNSEETDATADGLTAE